MGPNGAKISKGWSSYKLQPKVFKLVMNFPPNSPHKTTLGYFEFPIFSDFFSKILSSPLYPMEKLKTSSIWKISDRRAKRSEIWDSRVAFNIYGIPLTL